MYTLVRFHYDSSYMTLVYRQKKKIVLSTHYDHSKRVKDKIENKTM